VKTDVLIVGAGPVGLTLAAECCRDGVPFRIVDQAPGPSTHSKALAIWSGTMEGLSAIGLVESFLAAARPIRKMVFADGDKKIAEVPLAEGLDTLWPTPVILPQSETERLLLGLFENQGVSVMRNAECVEVQTTLEGVICKLKHTDGTIETIEAGWLAGCDGARSFVRRTLPVNFPGVPRRSALFWLTPRPMASFRVTPSCHQPALAPSF
jgi:2-polyprenyl-6-methoxyphenol hydroxylase-like FAD-dependent oxidoreductase